MILLAHLLYATVTTLATIGLACWGAWEWES